MAEDFYWPEADAMHALLMKHADLLRGCRSAEDEELRTLTEVIEAYEAALAKREGLTSDFAA